jgi:gas vesicle protein
MSRDDTSWSFAAGLFFGALTGAALASLFTPRSGSQNREIVREKGLVLKEQVTGATSSATSTVRERANVAATRVSSTVQTVRERAEDVAERASEVVDTVNTRVRETADAATDRASELAHRAQDVAERARQQSTTASSQATAGQAQVSAGPTVDQTTATLDTAVDRISDVPQQTSVPTGIDTQETIVVPIQPPETTVGLTPVAADRAAGRAESAVEPPIDVIPPTTPDADVVIGQTLSSTESVPDQTTAGIERAVEQLEELASETSDQTGQPTTSATQEAQELAERSDEQMSGGLDLGADIDRSRSANQNDRNL